MNMREEKRLAMEALPCMSWENLERLRLSGKVNFKGFVEGRYFDEIAEGLESLGSGKLTAVAVDREYLGDRTGGQSILPSLTGGYHVSLSYQPPCVAGGGFVLTVALCTTDRTTIEALFDGAAAEMRSATLRNPGVADGIMERLASEAGKRNVPVIQVGRLSLI